jgi:Helix-turn-helix.
MKVEKPEYPLITY